MKNFFLCLWLIAGFLSSYPAFSCVESAVFMRLIRAPESHNVSLSNLVGSLTPEQKLRILDLKDEEISELLYRYKRIDESTGAHGSRSVIREFFAGRPSNVLTEDSIIKIAARVSGKEASELAVKEVKEFLDAVGIKVPMRVRDLNESTELIAKMMRGKTLEKRQVRRQIASSHQAIFKKIIKESYPSPLFSIVDNQPRYFPAYINGVNVNNYQDVQSSVIDELMDSFSYEISDIGDLTRGATTGGPFDISDVKILFNPRSTSLPSGIADDRFARAIITNKGIRSTGPIRESGRAYLGGVTKAGHVRGGFIDNPATHYQDFRSRQSSRASTYGVPDGHLVSREEFDEFVRYTDDQAFYHFYGTGVHGAPMPSPYTASAISPLGTRSTRMNYNQISGKDSMALLDLDAAVLESRRVLIDNYSDRVREAVVNGDRFVNGGSVRKSLGVSSNPGVHAEVLATSDVLSFDRRLGSISYVDGCTPPSPCFVVKQGYEGDETTRLILSCLNDTKCLREGELNIEHQGLAGNSKGSKPPTRLNHELNRGEISFDPQKVVACIKSQSCPSGEISPKEIYHHIVGTEKNTIHFGEGVEEISSKDIKAKDKAIRSSIKGEIKGKLDEALDSVCPESLGPILLYCKNAYTRSFYHKTCEGKICEFPEVITEEFLRDSREKFVNATIGSKTGRMGVKEKCFNCHHILHGDHSLHAVEGAPTYR